MILLITAYTLDPRILFLLGCASKEGDSLSTSMMSPVVSPKEAQKLLLK